MNSNVAEDLGRGITTSTNEIIPSFSLAMASLPRVTGTASNVPPQQTSLPSGTHRSPVSRRFQNSRSRPRPSLHTILSNLPAAHGKFFDMLDGELTKVATFYVERENEMHERSKLLRKQLEELGVHRQILYESFAHSEAQGWVKRAGLLVPLVLSTWFPNTKPEEPHRAGGNGNFAPEPGRGGEYLFPCENSPFDSQILGRRGFADTSNFATPEHRRRDGGAKSAVEKGLGAAPAMILDDTPYYVPSKHSDSRPSTSATSKEYSLDPRAYQHAKGRLRKAVAEHYRGLEALNNYRTVNLTGFRKALRKYEKITQTEFVLEAYVKEKVEPSAFASGAIVGALLKEIEHLYARRFERGDRKKARDHLRVGLLSRTHGLSTFRFGLWLGLAIPAIVAGFNLSFQEYTRKTLPSWNILLLIYSIFLIPVAMVLLVGINIIIWARSKINYVFIFSALLLPYPVCSLTICTELNPRLRHDYQGYFELPSFLFCTLAYGFWFSMAQLGPPMLWPLVWLALTIVIMFNPCHSVMWGGTRWWTIKKIAKLGVSGIWNVEVCTQLSTLTWYLQNLMMSQFTDLWLGDQFCSLVYPLCSLFFVGCFYTRYNLLSSAHDPRAQEAMNSCGITQNWGWYYFLGMLPFLVRVVQSVRRYRDSKLVGQLVNVGIYIGLMLVKVLSSFASRRSSIRCMRLSGHVPLLPYHLTVTTCPLQEALIDWSMCQPYARYPLLRRDLVFREHIPVCFIVSVSDLFIRFIWLLYIFFDETSIELRVFIAAMLEIFRRAQWNIYRVENKHTANMEEHRITRELPLPYHFDAHPTEEEAYIARLQLRKRLARLSSSRDFE
ncbi:EXS family-domain-containing protein [Boletus reticuloceps]|uniref:EXS family-domain-containing protein n=1 Tax=Boletus reticuloceps TaxID=495285 RepID=A0A8I2YUF9_9AGAM|nr:EXS family-domain-containing protein [Boletus reticuloceps]